MLQDEINLLQNNNKELIGSPSEDKTIARSKIEKVTKSVLTRFVGIVAFISKTVPKWGMREMS